MIILALDTTGPDCSASLVAEDNVLAHRSEMIGRGHAERLGPMVEEALSEAKLKPSAIDRVAVCTGPGSFTGLRVALAFAKGFALPDNLPVIGVDALQIMAAQVAAEHDDHLIGVMRDVRRGEVFAGLYSRGLPVEPLRTMSPAEADDMVDEVQAALYEVKTIDTRVLGQMAATLDPSDYPAHALYARAPDAKLPGGVDPNAG
jgi:tRNA threonylcarbamoyl adenosine modification protein YeaZ